MSGAPPLWVDSTTLGFLLVIITSLDIKSKADYVVRLVPLLVVSVRIQLLSSLLHLSHVSGLFLVYLPIWLIAHIVFILVHILVEVIVIVILDFFEVQIERLLLPFQLIFATSTSFFLVIIILTELVDCSEELTDIWLSTDLFLL
jgi:hypothetical protein